MQTVILAGGLGTRLRTILDGVPKSMVEINGRPYLEYQIQYLKEQRLYDILILVGHKGDIIENHFKDGRKFGVRILYVREEKPLGTGGALKNAYAQLEEHFLLLYGDSYLPIDFAELIHFYTARNKKMVLVGYDNILSTDVKNNMAVNKNMNVIKYEKDSSTVDTDMRYVESGVVILSKTALDIVPAGKAISLEQFVFPKLIHAGEVSAFITPQRFYDIGTPERLKEIKKFFKKKYG